MRTFTKEEITKLPRRTKDSPCLQNAHIVGHGPVEFEDGGNLKKYFDVWEDHEIGMLFYTVTTSALWRGTAPG